MTKKPMTQADMKAVAAMLACPHQWGPEKNVRLVDEKKGKPRDGVLRTCASCGTHRIVYPGGTATLHSPENISDRHS